MRNYFFILFSIVTLTLPAQEKQDLSLEDAINTALENNYGIMTIQKDQELAELENSWGNAGALPNIRFVGSGNYSENFDNESGYTSENLSATVEMQQTLFRGFGVRIQKNKLEALEKLSEGNVSLVLENTIYDVILSYYNILLTREQVDIARSNMNLSKDRYHRARERKELGNAKTYEVLQAKNAFFEDSSEYISAQSSYNNTVRELNYLMAAPMDQSYRFTSEFEADTANFSRSVLTDKMLENNKTLRNQYINLELAQHDVKSAKSSYYPSLSLNASGGYSSSETNYAASEQAFDRNPDGYHASVGVSLSYALFDGNQRKRALEAAKIETQISDIEQEQMVRDLKNQLAQEYELYEVRKQLLSVEKENLETARLNLDISREKYQSGSISSFDFRDVQQTHQSAAYRFQQAVFDVIQSYHTLLRLTGGILEEYE
ncbi:MAG: TolC family protein [Marinilabiliaceae bacterium]